MSQNNDILMQLESLSVEELAKLLEQNGFAECVKTIHNKSIDGESFLKLTELQISLWRLPTTASRRLWNFVEQIRQGAPVVTHKSVNQDSKWETKMAKSYLTKPTIPSKRPDFNRVPYREKEELVKSEAMIGASPARREGEERVMSSFSYKNNNRPAKPPKREGEIFQSFKDSNKTIINQLESIYKPKENDSAETDDGYLLPNEVKNEKQPVADSNKDKFTKKDSSSFLWTRFKRKSDYENLQKRMDVKENKYEEKPAKANSARPLPPLPPRNITEDVVFEIDTDDEELVDGCEDNKRMSSQHRPLPTLPKQNFQTFPRHVAEIETNIEEELAEYAQVDEDNNEVSEHQRSLPPLPKSPENTSQTFPRTKRTLPFNTLTHTTVKPKMPAPKPPLRFETPPKLPEAERSSLPKPPVPMFDIVSSLESLGFEDVASSANAPNNNPEETEDAFYQEIDLVQESNYRKTDRKGARRLLAGLGDGAFLIRPSRQPDYICTFSILHSTRLFNLGLQMQADGSLNFKYLLVEEELPKFYNVSEIVKYYSTHPLHLSGQIIYLRDVLPRNKY